MYLRKCRLNYIEKCTISISIHCEILSFISEFQIFIKTTKNIYVIFKKKLSKTLKWFSFREWTYHNSYFFHGTRIETIIATCLFGMLTELWNDCTFLVIFIHRFGGNPLTLWELDCRQTQTQHTHIWYSYCVLVIGLTRTVYNIKVLEFLIFYSYNRYAVKLV